MELRAAIDAWQGRRLARRRVRPRTAAQQLVNLAQFVDWMEAHTGAPAVEVGDVTEDDCECYQAHLCLTPKPRGRGNLSESTVNQKISPIRTFFRDQHRRGLIRVDPWFDVPKLELPPPQPRALSLETIERLCAATGTGPKAFRDRTIIILSALTGLRVSEVAALKIEDYNPARREISIISAKTHRPDVVYVNDQAEEQLGAYIRYALDGRTEGPMWPSERGGGPIQANSISRIVSLLGREIGAQTNHHRLRHSYIKGMADRGTAMHVVQKAARHQSPNSTAIYAVASQVDVFAAAMEQPRIGA